ncbi:MAG: DUF2029 domain-containing protein [Anaerolineae bacterium]|nr:DUF2029 domain-containing protein [Anaerolineae bacterium]
MESVRARVSAVLTCLVVAAVLFMIPDLPSRWWLIAIIVPTAVLGFMYLPLLAHAGKGALLGLWSGITVGFGLANLQNIYTNYLIPPDFDLKWFWLKGRIGIQRLNFYQSEYARELAQNYAPGEELMAELVFWYPPPTMLFIAPMGLFDLQPGILFWYAVQIALLVVDIVLIWRLFLKDSGWVGLFFTSAMMLMLYPAIYTISLGQTSFQLLLFVLLFWRDRDHPRAGLWIALGVFTKPLFAVVFLYLLLRRRWRVFGASIISMALISLVTIVIFGAETFFSYFTGNALGQTPDFMYTEMVNQSLLAGIIRGTGYDLTQNAALLNPIFIVVGLALTAVTAWIVWRLKPRHEDWALVLPFMLILLLYPASLLTYSVLLILPIFLLISSRAQIPGKAVGVVVLLTVLYTILAFRTGAVTLAANLITWMVCALVGWRLTTKKHSQKNTA